MEGEILDEENNDDDLGLECQDGTNDGNVDDLGLECQDGTNDGNDGDDVSQSQPANPTIPNIEEEHPILLKIEPRDDSQQEGIIKDFLSLISITVFNHFLSQIFVNNNIFCTRECYLVLVYLQYFYFQIKDAIKNKV